MPLFFRRLISVLLSLLIASAVIFAVVDLVPGDPASFMLGTGARPDTVAALRERMADLTGWPGHEGLSWDGPALFLAGGESDYVSPEHEAEIRAAFPKAQLERVAGTSHWLHAEKPAEVVEAVVGFLG